METRRKYKKQIGVGAYYLSNWAHYSETKTNQVTTAAAVVFCSMIALGLTPELLQDSRICLAAVAAVAKHFMDFPRSTQAYSSCTRRRASWHTDWAAFAAASAVAVGAWREPIITGASRKADKCNSVAVFVSL
jgi:hypothetical protein